MSGRRERVTITAHGATDGAPDVTIEGQLESFRVDTRMTYDFGGQRMRNPGDDMVRVSVVMYLNPDAVKRWQSRGRGRMRAQPVQRLLTSRDRQVMDAFERVRRAGVLLMTARVDVRSYQQLTGRMPPCRLLPSGRFTHGQFVYVAGIWPYRCVRDNGDGTVLVVADINDPSCLPISFPRDVCDQQSNVHFSHIRMEYLT